MRILIFGATGMVGQGVLRESLEAADVELVQTIGRAAVGMHHPKLRDRCSKPATSPARRADGEHGGFGGFGWPVVSAISVPSRARPLDDFADGRDDQIGCVELNPMRTASGDDVPTVRRQIRERAMSGQRRVRLIAA